MRSRTPPLLAAVFLVFGLLFASLVWLLSPRVTPFLDDDSAAYIEAGRNLSSGNGLSTWPYDTDEDTGAPLVPLEVFPPVYPVMISLASLSGADAATAAIWIPRICFLLLPAALFLALRRVTGDGPAVAAAIVASLQVDLVLYALQAMSDVPFLLFAALGLAAVFEAIERESPRYALASGIALGLALGTRNSGLALPIAVAIGLAFGRILGLIRPRALKLFAIPHVVGFLVAYAPVVFRNFLVFGMPARYGMPASEKTWAEVFVELVRAADSTFLGGAVRLRVVGVLALLLLAVSFFLLSRCGRFRRLRGEHPKRLVFGSILFAYGMVGIALLVTAAASYSVDEISGRFLIQYSWIALGWILLLGARLVGWSGAVLGRARPVVAVLLMAVLLAPQFHVLKERRGEMAEVMGAMSAHEPIRALVDSLPDRACVVGVLGPKLRILFQRPVLELGNISPESLADRICRDRDLVVILFRCDHPVIVPWEGVFEGEIPAGYREMRREGDVVVLAHDKVPLPPEGRAGR